MSKQARISSARLVAAIKDSNGIKSVICANMPCNIQTLNKWIGKSAAVRAAYDDECSKMLGTAASVVTGNISAAHAVQEAEPGAIVDSTDAKWYLARKGRQEGYGTEEVAGQVVASLSLADWKKQAAKRRNEVEAL